MLERKKFDRAGNKTSKPEIRHVPINDWLSYAEDRFFEKHGYDVEILHDPTLGEGEAPMTASVGGGSAATAQTTASVKVTKKQLIEKLAKLVEVDPTTIDQKLTVKELEQQIAEYEKK